MIKSFVVLALFLVSIHSQAGQYRGYDRFEYLLEELDETLHQPHDANEAIDQFLKNDVRRQLFKLEGLSRLYKIQYEEFDPIYNKFKKLEDVLGKFIETKEYFEFAEKLDAPQAAQKKLKAKLDESRVALVTILEKSWLPDSKGVSGAEDMMEELYDMVWDPDATDRKLMLQSYARDVRKVIGNDYDMDKLQEGIHELRRRLRWFPIYIGSLDGLITIKKPIDETKITEWQLLIKKMNWSGKEKAVASVSYERYLKISDYIKTLGELKDQGEYTAALLAAMGGTAESKKWIFTRMQELGMKVRDVSKEAKVLYSEMRQSQVLEGLLKELTH
ncbi:MAG: hypothetical protein KA715_12980 [Xanthomonadaceae bacterium]|nr:hypothetical protein [Xanthomonadaceae bacterium]